MKEFGKQTYLRPLFRQLTLQPARSRILRRAQELLLNISGERKRRREAPSPARQYEPPQLNRLTPEQAKLKLLGSLSVGNEGARDLLDLVFPEPVEANAPQQAAAESAARSLRRTG